MAEQLPNKYLVQVGTGRKFPFSNYMASRNDMLLIVNGQQVQKPMFSPVEGNPANPMDQEEMMRMAVKDILGKMPKDELVALLNGEVGGTSSVEQLTNSDSAFNFDAL